MPETTKLHPLIQGLLLLLPEPGEWAYQEKRKWMRAQEAIFALLYRDPEEPETVAPSPIDGNYRLG